MLSSNDSSKAVSFMNNIAKKTNTGKTVFVLVSHIVSVNKPLIDALARNGRLAGVVAKPHSIDEKTLRKLQEEKVPLLKVRREDFWNPNLVERKIAPLIKPNEKLVIIDIGGYFAPVLEQLNQLKNLAGIVEDTENGLRRYEKALEKYPENKIPIMSIARSRIKDFEDYLVGKSIAESGFGVLAENDVDHKSLVVGVVGLGEVGRGAAMFLKHKGYEVAVFDKDKDVMNKAKLYGLNTKSKSALLRTSDVIIGASGNHSLNEQELDKMKEESYFFSCTSADDELGDWSKKIVEDGKKCGSKITKYKKVNFVNEGNAVNFVYPEKLKGYLEPFIYLTHCALIKCAEMLLKQKENEKRTGISSLYKHEENLLIRNFRRQLRDNSESNAFIKMLTKTGIQKF